MAQNDQFGLRFVTSKVLTISALKLTKINAILFCSYIISQFVKTISKMKWHYLFNDSKPDNL